MEGLFDNLESRSDPPFFSVYSRIFSVDNFFLILVIFCMNYLMSIWKRNFHIIFFFFSKNIHLSFILETFLETKAKLDKYYSESAPSFGMVQKCFTKFCYSRTSTETIPSPGPPNEITTQEMTNNIHDIVWNDPKVKVPEIAEIVSIPTERVVNILHTHLCMRKLCTVGWESYS